MKPFQEKLVAAWRDYAAGRIDAKTLKGASAGFGIYQQRDDLTMMRVRRPGGAIVPADLRAAAAILTKYRAPFIHLTSRQDFQFHGIAAADVPAALEACEAAGFAFRGGGGDTFRNVVASADSGLLADSVFDVRPYVNALSQAFYGFDLAYGLPRKIKIGFADRPADRLLAAVQDLGFVALEQDGRRVFEVWVAGGIGFKSRTGIRLPDVIPAEDCIRVAFALTRLFNDHGCRTNRAHARIRFLREDFGDERLVGMLREYVARETEAPRATPVPETPPPPTAFAENAAPAAGFDAWRALAARPLRSGRYSVRLFVPFGNLTADHLVRLADVLEQGGVTTMQLRMSQDILVPEVPASQLAAVYGALVGTLGDADYTVKSFRGHIVTCIGNTVCRIGAADSPRIGAEIAAALDTLLPADTPEKVALARAVLDDVRISGCPNSCTAQCAARFGFICRPADGRDALVPFTSAVADPPTLGTMTPDLVPVADLPARLRAALHA